MANSCNSRVDSPSFLYCRSEADPQGEKGTRHAQVPQWHIEGDWFDVCKCNVPCPCEFAQAPTYGDCEGVLGWHIKMRAASVMGRSMA